MNRRNFIRLAGGGIVATAAAGAVMGASMSTAFPAAAVQAWQGPGTETDARKRALAYALTAPNPHNLQPWLADLREPDAITLYCDRDRLLHHTDPFGRQILVGHGAFVELLVIALAEQGLRAQVTLWPQGEMAAGLKDWDRRPVAHVRLLPGGARDPLFAQVLRRHTPKVNFDTARAVSAGTLQALLDSVKDAGLRFGGTVDDARLPALRDLCVQAARVELQTERTVMESLHLTRVGPDEILKSRDGISVNGAVPRVFEALGMFDRSAAPKEGSAAFSQMMGFMEGHALSAMGFVWLATPGNSRTHQVEAGRAYVRLQLKATELGVGMHPLSQALQEFPEMAAQYAGVHQLLIGKPAPRNKADETVQMFCRIGYPKDAVQATPRRPLQALLVA